MPGVLQVEALAQLAGIVCLQMEGAEPGAVFFFAGVDGVKWKKPVVPGDTLVMEVEIKKWNKRFGIATAEGRAYVDGEIAVELDEMYVLCVLHCRTFFETMIIGQLTISTPVDPCLRKFALAK